MLLRYGRMPKVYPVLYVSNNGITGLNLVKDMLYSRVVLCVVSFGGGDAVAMSEESRQMPKKGFFFLSFLNLNRPKDMTHGS
jgi:hypothetical protein